MLLLYNSQLGLITVFTMMVAIIGWFINSWMQRRHEIAKERLRHRMDALKASFPIFSMIRHNHPSTLPEFNRKLEEAETNINVYGKKKERENMNALFSLVKEGRITEAQQHVEPVLTAFAATVRSELKINDK